MAIENVSGITTASKVNTFQAERRPIETEKVETVDSSPSKGVELLQSSTSNLGNKSVSENKSKDNTENHLKSVISMTNEKIHWTNTRCEFQYHEITKRVSIKVIDKETDEIIREIPPEESLEMVEKMWELAGLIVDERC